MDVKAVCGSAQVMEAVHGVTTDEVQSALQSNDWNPVRAEQQLKVGLETDTHTQRMQSSTNVLANMYNRP